MSLSIDALEAEVLKLPVQERTHLLDRLIASIEADPVIHRAWALEAERRDAEFEAGRVKPVPGDEVINRLRAQLP